MANEQGKARPESGYYVASTDDPVRWCIIYVTHTGSFHVAHEGEHAEMRTLRDVLEQGRDLDLWTD